MSDNQNTFNCIYSLLTCEECSTELCLIHPNGGYIAVDNDLSNIYISANDFINASNATNSNTSICINYSDGDGANGNIIFYTDDDLSKYVSISNCGQQYVIAIDISQVPIKRGIYVCNLLNLTDNKFNTVQYGDAIYGHYHCNTEFSEVDKCTDYSDSNIKYGQVCGTLEPPSLSGSVSELDDNCLSPSKLPINRDYLCIPNLYEKPSIEYICSYCIAMMHDSHYLFSANKCQLPMKYLLVPNGRGSIFTEDGWKGIFNSKCHIYDGDLPYIDIQLLCQISNSDYKLSTDMIPYSSISFNESSGVVTSDGSNSVTANNLKDTLNSIVNYIRNYIGLEVN